MNLKEIVEQLKDLKYSQEMFDKGTEDTEVFRKDIYALDYAIKVLEPKIPKIEVNERYCDECGELMWDGYCIENGMEYYCSDECLHKHYTEEEWDEMYDEGNGDSYYTDWYEEMEEYNKIKGDEK